MGVFFLLIDVNPIARRQTNTPRLFSAKGARLAPFFHGHKPLRRGLEPQGMSTSCSSWAETGQKTHLPPCTVLRRMGLSG
jgi:hypothetical protein